MDKIYLPLPTSSRKLGRYPVAFPDILAVPVFDILCWHIGDVQRISVLCITHLLVLSSWFLWF